MAFSDLRTFIDLLRSRDELAEIPVEVDWRYEIGAIVRKNLDMEGPALLFTRIRDYKSRLFTCGLSTYGRVAAALGLPPGSGLDAIVAFVAERLRRPIEPETGATGPCKEVVLADEGADVLQLPVPLWQALDGGRYIGTWHGVVTRDPDTGCLNVGMYRTMVHDSRRLGILLARDQHIGQHFQKYRRMKRAMPVAIVIGTDPVLPLAYLAPLPLQKDEYAFAGGLRGEPVRLVRCETADLQVPATTEIVIEGEILPDERQDEGPFGEWMGHYGGEVGPRPVIRVSCITHRRDPIFRGTLEGRPVNEDHVCTSIMLSAIAYNFLTETLGIAGVRGVHFPAAAGGWGMAIVSLDQRYPGHARTAAHGLFAGKAGAFVKTVVVVDEDIDPFDLNQVWWAMTARLQASRGVSVMTRGKGAFMDPSCPPEMRGFTDTLLIEAIRPYEWQPRKEWGGERFPPVAYPTREAMASVEKRWAEYGITGRSRKDG
jgi:4-hydroxy-3-polyprenylbenzoate decarboxylase